MGCLNDEERVDMKAYLQDSEGNEVELKVTKCDPDDGTFVVHTVDDAYWIRIVPNEENES